MVGKTSKTTSSRFAFVQLLVIDVEPGSFAPSTSILLATASMSMVRIERTIIWIYTSTHSSLHANAKEAPRV